MEDNNFWTVTIISTSLAGVSTIACLVAIGALLFFKAYRNFIYRLMLYILATLTITSLCTMIKYLMSIIKVDLRDNNITIQDNGTGFSTAHFIASYAVQSGVLTALLLITCVTLCIYLMALHHCQFTSRVVDIVCLLISLAIPQLLACVLLVICSGKISPLWSCNNPGKEQLIGVVFVAVLFIVNAGVMVLTLVPLCCGVCEYRLMMRTIGTRKSHRQALKETIPLFLLPLSSFVYCSLMILILPVNQLLYSYASILADLMVISVVESSQGLVVTFLFATHLCILGKTKLRRLRGKTRSLVTTMPYGSIAGQRCSYNPTVFTSEGLSDTCNTDYPHVSEDEVDRQLLTAHNSRTQHTP